MTQEYDPEMPEGYGKVEDHVQYEFYGLGN